MAKNHYVVSRVYHLRMVWEVEAASAEEALAMLDDHAATPSDSADEEWLGPLDGTDRVTLINEEVQSGRS